MNRDPQPQNREEQYEIIRKGAELESPRPPVRNPLDDYPSSEEDNG